MCLVFGWVGCTLAFHAPEIFIVQFQLNTFNDYRFICVETLEPMAAAPHNIYSQINISIAPIYLIAHTHEDESIDKNTCDTETMCLPVVVDLYTINFLHSHSFFDTFNRCGEGAISCFIVEIPHFTQCYFCRKHAQELIVDGAHAGIL